MASSLPLFIPPLFNLAALILTLLASLSPVPILHHTALLTVTPSKPLQSQKSIDTPIVWMGLFGTCVQSNSSAPTICTKAGLFEQYNLSVLTTHASTSALLALTPPPALLTKAAFVAILLTFLFFVSTSLLSIRSVSNTLWAFTQNPPVMIGILVIGFLTAMGVIPFLLLRHSFVVARSTFNAFIELEGQDPKHIQVSLGNGFTYIWIGYGLLCLPIIELFYDFQSTWKYTPSPFTDSHKGE